MSALNGMISDRERGLMPSNRQIAEHLFEDVGMPLFTFRNNGLVFFEPDIEFIDWLIEYANGRYIIDVGCGTGHVLKLLRSRGYHKVTGIEPSWDYAAQAEADLKEDRSILQVMPWPVERCGSYLHGLTEGGKSLVLFCRPCHSDFVEIAVDMVQSGTEVMYITKPENLQEYQDLGQYQKYLESIVHRGTSSDNEVVCVLTKP